MEPDPTDILDEIKRSLRWLSVATVVLFLALAALAGRNFIVSSDVNDSLCALRSDLERRVESSEKFLRENPKGIPGIPATTLQTSINNQRLTVVALDNLNC